MRADALDSGEVANFRASERYIGSLDSRVVVEEQRHRWPWRGVRAGARVRDSERFLLPITWFYKMLQYVLVQVLDASDAIRALPLILSCTHNTTTVVD